MEVRETFLIKTSNMFAALEELSDNKDVKRAWESVTESIKTPVNL
jgi:hypothetical protein